MEKNPILVIDDEPSYLDLMKGLLNDEGFTNVTHRSESIKCFTSSSENRY